MNNHLIVIICVNIVTLSFSQTIKVPKFSVIHLTQLKATKTITESHEAEFIGLR